MARSEECGLNSSGRKHLSPFSFSAPTAYSVQAGRFIDIHTMHLSKAQGQGAGLRREPMNEQGGHSPRNCERWATEAAPVFLSSSAVIGLLYSFLPAKQC